MIHGNPIPAASLRQTAVVLSAVLADISDGSTSQTLHHKAIAAALASVRETLDRRPPKGRRHRSP